ncbi:hypothetical protein HON22_05555 [Candidatus Peregrinibacteria bacterium]|nr:hypothetical protein [Candidatus Peregrinibacteria bacterium]
MLISVIVFAYAVLKKDDYYNNPIIKIKSFMIGINFFFVGYLFGLVFILFMGFEAMLFFIPKDWGGFTREGEWFSRRENIAQIASVIMSLYIVDKTEDKLRESRRK